MSEIRAEVSSFAPTNADNPLDSLDAEARFVVRLAAEIGRQSNYVVTVGFTSLLVALLYTRSNVLEYITKEAPSIEFEYLLNHLKVSMSEVEQCAGVAQRSDGRFPPWPPLSEFLTPNAQKILASAAGYARRESVTVTDLLLAYLMNKEPAVVQRLEDWGFTEKTRSSVASFLSGVPDKPTPGSPYPDLPGFDAAASRLLRLGQVVARSRKTVEDPSNTASTLLVAIADAAQVLTVPELPEIDALRANIGADDPGSRFARYRANTYGVANAAVAQVAAGETSIEPPAESEGLQSVKEEAIAIAQLTTASGVAAPRHLAVALILTRTGEINDKSDRVISRRGLRVGLWREQLGTIVADHYRGDDQAAWRRILNGPRIVPSVQADTIPTDPRTADALSLRHYSDAIGALIASRTLRPPLSIAIFGAWGSGKSFFMRMIRRAVEEFTGEAVSPVDGEARLFLDGVVHIDFNAWHYAEENLWASLIQAILVGVKGHLQPKRLPQSVFEQVLGNLVQREKAETDARVKLAEAEQSLKEARSKLAQAEFETAGLREKQAQLAADDVIKPLRESAIDWIRPLGGDPGRWIRGISESLVQAAEIVGRPELADDVPALRGVAEGVTETAAALEQRLGDVHDVVEQIRGGERRGLALLAWLMRQKMAPRERKRLLTRVSWVLASVLVLAILAFLFHAQILGVIFALAAFVGPAIAGLGPVLDWLRRQLASVDEVFANVEDLQRRIDAKRRERLAEHETKLRAAQHDAREAEASLARRRDDVEVATTAVAEAREVVRAATGIEQMKRFVGQRLDEGDYLRRLGLIHTINVDLAQLESLLRQVEHEASTPGGGPTVRRIVLYIDDLDRCPPKRVVEVLEAVHLLLAFELFVVVVGVDIRWVEQALKARYPQQLATEQPTPPSSHLPQALSTDPGIASPMDYLEKVFQIPFWLPPMDRDGGKKLLAAAIGTGVAGRQAEGEAASAEPPSAQPALVLADAVVGANNIGDVGDRSEPASPVGAAPQTSEPHPVIAASVGRALEITAGELKQIVELAEAVGISPRRAKRFANLYRVLKASLLPEERAAFVTQDGAAGSYRVALILLAMTTGAPRASAQLLRETITISDPDTVAPADRLDRLLKVIPTVEEEAAEFAAASAMRQEMTKAADKATFIQMLRFWAPRVRRFAFETGRF